MAFVDQESAEIATFRAWFAQNGGRLYEDLFFTPDSSGLAIRTRRALQAGVTAASCPFSLAITLEATQEALEKFCRLPIEAQHNLSQRQRMCAYIGLHYIIREEKDETCTLRHRPYLNILPKAENLRTPLYFTDTELDLFRGTNLYGAALSLRETLVKEHRMLHDIIAKHAPNISEKFAYDIYQISATYLSSRSFPSTLLSSTPSLIATPESYPVLLPGVDMFNHKRGHPVHWRISRADASSASPSTFAAAESNSSPTADAGPNVPESDLHVALTIDIPTVEGQEIFNNYGPKPNSSLIVGYGFALPDNPDDMILLKIGSRTSRSRSEGDAAHEVWRNASGAQTVWDDARMIIATQYGDTEDRQTDSAEEADAAQELQIDMETAGTLSGLVSTLIAQLPNLSADHSSVCVRREVESMWRYYVQGQKDILEALLDWLEVKDREAIRRAQELGIDIVGDDLEDE